VLIGSLLLGLVLEQIQVRVFLVELPDFLLVVEIINSLLVPIAHFDEVARQFAGLLRPLAKEALEIAAMPAD